jgi:tetratricopeptide (TPR) repeat protein
MLPIRSPATTRAQTEPGQVGPWSAPDDPAADGPTPDGKETTSLAAPSSWTAEASTDDGLTIPKMGLDQGTVRILPKTDPIIPEAVKMTKRIVFIGNCQMEVMRGLYDKFVAGITGDETFFLPAWTELDDNGTKILETADLLVDQVQSFSREIVLPPAIAAVRRVSVPLVSASFLWPFAGSPHPSNADSPFLKGGPYPGELGDGFLNRLIKEGVPADRALEQYRRHDLGGPAALDRRYELIIDQQRLRDQGCNFLIAPEIEKYFRKEHLFLSPHHPGLRITRALAAQCLYHMGAPQRCIEMLIRELKRSPFPPDELPVHPEVARHFKLEYLRPDTDFDSRGEGRFTWEQWVLRYLNYAWSPELFEGWTIVGSDPTRARKLLSSVVEELPRSPLAHAAMAKALLALHEYEPALSHITEAVRLAPREPEFTRTGAFIASRMGRRAEAVKFAKEAATFDAGNVGNLQLLAKLQEDTADFAAAEETRRISVELRPNMAGLWGDLGTTLASLDRLDESLESYRRARELAPNEAGAHFGTSLVLARLGRTEDAILAVETAIRLRPGVAPYLSHLGHLLLRVARREDGIAAFKKALEFDPGNAGIHNLLGDLMLKDHLSKEGLCHAMKAADSAPSVPQYQVRVAHLLTRHLRLVEAIEAYRRAIALMPNDRTLHSELGALFVRLDRLEEAASELNLAIDPVAPTGKSVFDLGTVLMRMGRFTDAKDLVDAVVKLQPDEAQLRVLQAEIEDVIAGRRFAAVGSKFVAIQVDEIVPAMEFVAPACVRYTNFQEMNPTFGTHHVDNLYVEKRRWVPAVSLCQLPEHARLAVPNGEEFIAIAGTQILVEQVRRDWPDENLTDALAACTEHATITEPAVLIGRYGIRTWGHWLGELLPKIVAVESKWPGRFRYILPDRFGYDPVHVTAMESLAYYGLGKDRLILVAPRTTYTCSNLYAVTSAWSAERALHPEIAALMRELGSREREPATGWLNAALLRRSTRTRNIQNISAVEDILVADGFAIVDIEKLNFRQQVDLFKNANAIACVLGSGLTGLMYAPRGVKVLTMAPGEWGDLFFYSMMQERDAVFVDVRGRTVATDRDGVGTSGFTVPTEALRAGLRAIGLENEAVAAEVPLARETFGSAAA